MFFFVEYRGWFDTLARWRWRWRWWGDKQYFRVSFQAFKFSHRHLTILFSICYFEMPICEDWIPISWHWIISYFIIVIEIRTFFKFLIFFLQIDFSKNTSDRWFLANSSSKYWWPKTEYKILNALIEAWLVTYKYKEQIHVRYFAYYLDEIFDDFVELVETISEKRFLVCKVSFWSSPE